MRIHYLQHEPFEDTGCIAGWASEKGYQLSATRFYENAQLPSHSGFDWLVVMGGSMGIYDEEKYGWLKEEKKFIHEAILQNKKVLGICLGSQLIAHVLGAKVSHNREKEIGWFPVSVSKDLPFKNPLFDGEHTFTVFHWHGDTFEIPENAYHLTSSEACTNQAFIYKEKVIGLQFHFEVTEKTLHQMVASDISELEGAKHVQTAETILKNNFFAADNNKKMFRLLDYLDSK